MSIDLRPELTKFIDEQVKAGRYDSAEDVVAAGLATLEQQERWSGLPPAELNRLLAAGDADIQSGDVHDGESVFRELDELSALRRREQSR